MVLFAFIMDYVAKAPTSCSILTFKKGDLRVFNRPYIYKSMVAKQVSLCVARLACKSAGGIFWHRGFRVVVEQFGYAYLHELFLWGQVYGGRFYGCLFPLLRLLVFGQLVSAHFLVVLPHELLLGASHVEVAPHLLVRHVLAGRVVLALEAVQGARHHGGQSIPALDNCVLRKKPWEMEFKGCIGIIYIRIWKTATRRCPGCMASTILSKWHDFRFQSKVGLFCTFGYLQLSIYLLTYMGVSLIS